MNKNNNVNNLSFFNILNTNLSFLWQYRNIIVFLTFLFSSFIIFIIFIIFIYLYRCLKRFVFSNCVRFNKYNLTSKKTINLYGKYNIKSIYLVKHNLNYLTCLILNILSVNKLTNLLQYYRKTTGEDISPTHVSLIAEVYLPDSKESKLILIEKNWYINISTDFFLSNKCHYKHLSVPVSTNLKKLLTGVKKTLGKKKYYNWYKNNTCQHFISSILDELNISDTIAHTFIKQDLFHKCDDISPYTMYVLNFSLNLHNTLTEFFA